MNVDLNDYVYRHLTTTEHLIRDLQQSLILAGDIDHRLDGALCIVREAVERAASSIRVA
jgi:hypothetical protein